ncbi:uncharacterized protein LOC113294659 [Papaver somniferum]|uniref:uncharacterized protein LOC113294659 n=1 Tax=Papaver somniferum TaxID=3469 RepID=UPI000E705304|nr:uncharacterized protein LOC113294659 [Papaver somniferum]
MGEKLTAHKLAGTWDMVDLPPGKPVVGSHWVYKFKTKSYGTLERCKSRVVSQGNTQQYGINCEETFALVAHMTIVVHFLQRLLQIPYDSAMFIRKSEKGIVLLLLYVDDMVITSSDSEGIKSLKSHLNSCFQMKYLGHLRYFLGIEVNRSSEGYFISQVKYASEIFNRDGLTDSKVSETPLELNVKLNPIDGKALSDPTLYRQLVGSLNYLTITRLNISYAVHIVSQFMSAPRTTHFAAISRILRYIKGTLYKGLQFSSKSDLRLHAYTDSDWAGDVTDKRSTYGYCIFPGNSLISCHSKK